MYRRSDDHPGRTDRPSGAEAGPRRPRSIADEMEEAVERFKRDQAEGWHVPVSGLARFDAWGTPLDGPPRKQRQQKSWTFYQIGGE